MIQLSPSEIKLSCKFILVPVSLNIKIKVQITFSHERMTLTYMYLCNMFFLKTQGRTHKSSFGMPSISLNQSNLKIHAAAEDQEMGD